MAGSPNFPNDGSTYDGYDSNTTSTSTADSIQVPTASMDDMTGAGYVVSELGQK